MDVQIKCATLNVVLVISTARAQNNVVVIPHGDRANNVANNFVGEATFSIPVTALRQSNGSLPDFSSTLQVILKSSGTTTFGTSFVIPQDHKPGTVVYVDIFVYNPEANGACQAVIRVNYGRSWKPGEDRDGSVIISSIPFPAFSKGEQTYVFSNPFQSDKGAGHTLGFGYFRSGDNSADNCGDVGLVGMQVRYQRE